jgi:hypothetical protein
MERKSKGSRSENSFIVDSKAVSEAVKEENERNPSGY